MQIKDRKILVVTHYYPPHTGGIEYVAQNQTKALAARGAKVVVVTSRVSSDEKDGIENGITIIRVKALNIFEKWGIPYPIFSPRLLQVLRKAVKNTELVHIHDSFYISSWCAALAARLYNRPIVLTQHVDFVPHQSRLVRLLQKLVYGTGGALVITWSSVIITLNERVKSFLIKRGVDSAKISLMPNGVDCDLFHPASAAEKKITVEKYRLASDKKIVLFVGRIVAKKGFDKVLAARSNAYQLVFVGGTLKGANSPMARFLGKLPQPKLAEIYRAADIFVLPSHGEGFPLTIQEAMASGLPVIMTDDAGYGAYGLSQDLVLLLGSRPSTQQVRQAIQSLLNDEARCRQMAKRSVEYVQQRFSWVQVANEFEHIYLSLLESEQKPS